MIILVIEKAFGFLRFEVSILSSQSGSLVKIGDLEEAVTVLKEWIYSGSSYNGRVPNVLLYVRWTVPAICVALQTILLEIAQLLLVHTQCFRQEIVCSLEVFHHMDPLNVLVILAERFTIEAGERHLTIGKMLSWMSKGIAVNVMVTQRLSWNLVILMTRNGSGEKKSIPGTKDGPQMINWSMIGGRWLTVWITIMEMTIITINTRESTKILIHIVLYGHVVLQFSSVRHWRL